MSRYDDVCSRYGAWRQARADYKRACLKFVMEFSTQFADIWTPPLQITFSPSSLSSC
jgi:hypothetical protein